MSYLERSTYVVGYGYVFFDRFAPGALIGEGERYLGHATAISVSRTVSKIDRVSARGGVLVQTDAHITGEQESIQITVDSIDRENVALWFGGAINTVSQAASAPMTEEIVVKRGRYYQIGKSIDPVMGIRNVDYVEFRIDDIVIVQAGNIEVDPPSGRFRVVADAPDVADDDTISVNFQRRQAVRHLWQSEPRLVEGAIRFVPKNLKGPGKGLYVPRAVVTPDRSLDLINESAWATMTFSADARPLNALTKLSYSDEYADVGTTYEEDAIIELGGVSLEEFLVLEDQLDRIVNIDMPADFGGA